MLELTGGGDAKTFFHALVGLVFCGHGAFLSKENRPRFERGGRDNNGLGRGEQGREAMKNMQSERLEGIIPGQHFKETHMFRFIAAVVLFVLAAQVLAADAPKEAKKEPPKPAEFIIGEMHVQTIPAQDFIYGSAETTFESREMYLYFEEPESVNNVVQIQIGVK